MDEKNRSEKTVWKWFWVWEFEKEERWLNEQAFSGWVLDGVSFCQFRFIACDPGEYAVRLEMRGPDSDYVSFMEETGAEYVGRMLKWIYFRKKVENGAFDLFSDIDSRIRHLERIARLLFIVGMLNLCTGFVNSWYGSPVGWINLLVCAVLMYGLGRIHEKIGALERERLLRE